ncbi:hypothetical protein XELAEV_18008098mg [Xenopus laevis]|uniref:Tyr recombinase domain-containing protein n=1 Tax=Xenopus laevis TaxID=8355 RepID=A0A974I5B8_XENLA|nr:hypothetical protein XELAEV_18008098mg [Xenopus laevis]
MVCRKIAKFLGWLGPSKEPDFQILVAVFLWGEKLKDRRFIFWCDNQSVVHVIKRQTTSSLPVLELLRALVLQCLRQNIWFRARLALGVKNGIATLSRIQFTEFRNLAPHAEDMGQRESGGFAFLFQLFYWKDVTKEFVVRKVLKGWKNSFRSKDTRRPVSFSILSQLVTTVHNICSTVHESTLFSLAFSVAFFGAMRIGELVSPARNKLGGLLYSDMHAHESSLTIVLRRSKTDQRGKGRTITLEATGQGACPVRLAHQYLGIMPGAEGPLIIHENGIPLTRYQFVAIFRQELKAMGLNSAAFSSHSFCIGAATEAHRQGFTDVEVKRIGRWESGRNVDLIHTIKQDLLRCATFRQECVVVWSEIISRQSWWDARDQLAIERCRKKLNVSVSAFVRRMGGVIVRLTEMETDGPRLMMGYI